MEMAQVVQHILVFGAHAAGEVRIVQALMAGRFGHVLEKAKALLNGLPAIPGQLLPSRNHVVAEVFALGRAQLAPNLFTFADVLALLRVQAIPALKVLPDLVLPLGRHALKLLVVPQHALALLRRQVAQTVHPGR